MHAQKESVKKFRLAKELSDITSFSKSAHLVDIHNHKRMCYSVFVTLIFVHVHALFIKLNISMCRKFQRYLHAVRGGGTKVGQREF
jgi:hypothetical protein